MAKDVKFLDKSRQTERPRDAYKWIGKDMKRVEDPRLLTGNGIYIDDVQLPKMAHAAVLRSPHAHARIMSIDTSKAKNSPGVILVMTGAEAAEVTGPTASFASPPCPQYCLAVDRVRHVGEAVAAVVAESRYLAEDAIDLIEVAYEALPVVVDPEAAIESSGDAVLHPDRGDTNVSIHRELGQIMWNQCGMSRSENNLKEAIESIAVLREEFWQNVKVLGSGESFNQNLEHAGRVADFLEFAELLAFDALQRNESSGGHFREEYQTPENEALRDDENFCYVAAWEFNGVGQQATLHKEPLTFEEVPLATRSYK